jgi:hypothetical protein
MNNKVSVGVTSVIGWLTAFLALLPAIIKAIEGSGAAFTGPGKYLAVFGIASGLVTNVARYLQAHKLLSVAPEENDPIGEETVLPPEPTSAPPNPSSE